MTWNAGGDDDGDSTGVRNAPLSVDSIMTLSDNQLAELLGVGGASVPIMLDGDGVAPRAAGDGDDDQDNTNTRESSAASRAPSTAAEAIDRGLEQYRATDYPAALATFQSALDLAGSGPIKFRNAIVRPAGPSAGFKEREVSLAEQIAVHYNVACCYARLNDIPAGLSAVKKSLEVGYDDYANLRKDPDLAPLRSDPRFNAMVARYEPTGFVGDVFNAMKGNFQGANGGEGGDSSSGTNKGVNVMGGFFDMFAKKK